MLKKKSFSIGGVNNSEINISRGDVDSDSGFYVDFSGGLGANRPPCCTRTWACNPRFPSAKIVLGQSRQTLILLLKNILPAPSRFALTGGRLALSQTQVKMTAGVRDQACASPLCPRPFPGLARTHIEYGTLVLSSTFLGARCFPLNPREDTLPSGPCIFAVFAKRGGCMVCALARPLLPRLGRPACGTSGRRSRPNP